MHKSWYVCCYLTSRVAAGTGIFITDGTNLWTHVSSLVTGSFAVARHTNCPPASTNSHLKTKGFTNNSPVP